VSHETDNARHCHPGHPGLAIQADRTHALLTAVAKELNEHKAQTVSPLQLLICTRDGATRNFCLD